MNSEPCLNCFVELAEGQENYCSTECRELFEETMRVALEVIEAEEGE